MDREINPRQSSAAPALAPLLLSALLAFSTLGGAALWAGQEPTTTAAPAPEEARPNQPQPPDGVWLEDEQGQYFIEKYPKIEGSYRWLDEEKGMLRFRNSPMIRIDSHDDEFFYVRINKVKPRAAEKTGPSPEEIAAVEATYPGSPESQDLLEMKPFENGLPTTGQWRNGFVVEDLNGDGHLDIVHGAARKSGAGPVVALGDSEGNWRRWEELSLPELPYDYGDVAVADFNGDGVLDVAYAVHLRGFLALAGDGKGGFTDIGQSLPMHGVKGRTTRAFTSRTIVATDWNQDGRPDLLALSEGPASAEQVAEGVEALRGKAVLLNGADGWSLISSDPDDRTMGDHLAVGDIDGDGRLDFVTDVRISGNKELINLGTADGRWQRRELEQLRPTSTAWAVELDDMDLDGNLDVVVAFRSFELGGARDGIDVFLGDGAGGFERRGVVSNSDNAPYSELETGDLDGNGHPDIVTLDARGQTRLYLQRADGEFVEEASPELLPDDEHRHCVGYRARLVDLNGDGLPELIATFAGEPGSEALFGDYARCKARGAIRVWSATLGTGGGVEDSGSSGS